MQLAHSFTVPASAERTWALLTDLHQVGGCFPGATVTKADEQEFSGTVKVKLGPIAMLYSGSGRFVLRDDVDHHAVIEAQGKDKRGNGTAGATVTLHLQNEGELTRVEVGTDLSVTGKPAQFGRGVMQDVSDKLLGRFVDCIEEHLGAKEDATAQPVTVPDLPTEDDAIGMQADEAAAAASAAAAVRPVPTRSGPPPANDDDAINLGGAVAPVLLRRYGPVASAAVAGVVLGYLLGRRNSTD
ncbi:MAG: SRPBCC family protein [Ornithinimicrobium sp.]|jgi:carbon monoxide dehydrogenase subunit G|uniref:SRPBCC family protein n=1 Tax=Ornithinimicrobium sp. TaxID=1977084 RepID=UPI003D9B91D3